MSDRYVFARGETYEFMPYGTGPHTGERPTRTRFVPTAVPAPSPEDWRNIVDAVEAYHDGDEGMDDVVLFSDIARATVAAVRNMREAER